MKMSHILVVIPAKRDPVWFTLHTVLILVVHVNGVLVSVQNIRQESPKSSSGLRRIMGMRDGLAGVSYTRCWVCGCRRYGRTSHPCTGHEDHISGVLQSLTRIRVLVCLPQVEMSILGVYIPLCRFCSVADYPGLYSVSYLCGGTGVGLRHLRDMHSSTRCFTRGTVFVDPDTGDV
jgi:hypothetical protein